MILDSKSRTRKKRYKLKAQLRFRKSSRVTDVSAENKENEDGEIPEEEEMLEEAQEDDETTVFLGTNPADQVSDEIDVRKDVAERIYYWIKKGFTEKDEKEALLKNIPRKGQLNLEAPLLNEEISTLLQRKPRTKDEHFREYQNLTSAALSSNATALSILRTIFYRILSSAENFSERENILTLMSNSVKLLSDLFFQLTQVRKLFLAGHFDEDMQKALKNIEPIQWLFGDNLKATLENIKAVERVSKDLKLKGRQPLRNNQNLNSRNPSAQREVPRSGYRLPYQRQGTSRHDNSRQNNSNRQKPYPARRYYHQSQPHQRSSRH